MSRPAALIYRCRACGEVHHPFFTLDGARALESMLGGIPSPPEWGGRPPRMAEPHECSDRTTGVSDFVGVRFGIMPDDGPEIPRDASPGRDVPTTGPIAATPP
jgi:hypothetical protein